MTTTTPMSAPFEALALGLHEFRLRIAGESGEHRQRLLRIAGSQGLVIDIVRAVLDGLRSAIEWVRDAIDEVDDYFVLADAALALVEVLGSGTQALGDVIAQTPATSDEPLRSLHQFGGALQTVGSALSTVSSVRLPSIIPTPEQLDAIKTESSALVARAGVTEPAPPGSIDELLAALAQPRTP